jgi:hypothetical protein
MTGAAIATGAISATGVSTAQFIGAAIASGAITSVGASTAVAVGTNGNAGGVVVAGAGSAAGTSAAQAVGATIIPHDYYQDGYRTQKRGDEDEELMAIAAMLVQVIETTYYGRRA